MIDFKNHLFRCSSLGHLMPDPQGKTNAEKYSDAVLKLAKLQTEYDAIKDGLKSKVTKGEAIEKTKLLVAELLPLKDKVELSETAKVHCMDIYIRETTGRKTDITNRYIEKGLTMEEDSITLYSRIKKRVYNKNSTRLYNPYITGEPDIFDGQFIHQATDIKDIKTSWDLYTFGRTYARKLSKLYEWQVKGYEWLTGAKTGSIAYCLVNTPKPLIEAEQKKLWYKLGQPDEQNANYIAGCIELEQAMTYDDIPLSKRCLEYTVLAEEDDAPKIIAKVLAGREYLQQLHSELQWGLN